MAHNRTVPFDTLEQLQTTAQNAWGDFESEVHTLLGYTDYHEISYERFFKTINLDLELLKKTCTLSLDLTNNQTQLTSILNIGKLIENDSDGNSQNDTRVIEAIKKFAVNIIRKLDIAAKIKFDPRLFSASFMCWNEKRISAATTKKKLYDIIQSANQYLQLYLTSISLHNPDWNLKINKTYEFINNIFLDALPNLAHLQSPTKTNEINNQDRLILLYLNQWTSSARNIAQYYNPKKTMAELIDQLRTHLTSPTLISEKGFDDDEIYAANWFFIKNHVELYLDTVHTAFTNHIKNLELQQNSSSNFELLTLEEIESGQRAKTDPLPAIDIISTAKEIPDNLNASAITTTDDYSEESEESSDCEEHANAGQNINDELTDEQTPPFYQKAYHLIGWLFPKPEAGDSPPSTPSPINHNNSM